MVSCLGILKKYNSPCTNPGIYKRINAPDSDFACFCGKHLIKDERVSIEGHFEKEYCSICLNNSMTSRNSITTDCKHRFHRKCLQNCASYGIHVCPNCRKDIKLDLACLKPLKLNLSKKKTDTNVPLFDPNAHVNLAYFWSIELDCYIFPQTALSIFQLEQVIIDLEIRYMVSGYIDINMVCFGRYQTALRALVSAQTI